MSEADIEAELKVLQSQAVKKQTSRVIALCQLCDSNDNIYVCEQGHKNLFCKQCLTETNKSNSQDGNSINHNFKAKCTGLGDCNYNPLVPGGMGGLASDPFDNER